jgi:hypothetical protein
MVSRTALPGDIVNLHFVAEQVISRMKNDGYSFPDDVVEMMVLEAREAIANRMSAVAIRERS